MALEPTVDPSVFIEEKREGYVRYQRLSDGRRWEVFGTCDKRGHCMVGAVIGGQVLETLEQARSACSSYTGLDCPVTPEFQGCCPFTYAELEPLNGY